MEFVFRDALANNDITKAKKALRSNLRQRIKDTFDMHKVVSSSDDSSVMSESLFQLLATTFPETLLVPDKFGNLPLHVALENCMSMEKITILIDANPKALWITGQYDCLPIHTLYSYWESPDKEILSDLECLQQKRDLIHIMLEHNPKSTLVCSKTQGSLLEQVCQKTVAERSLLDVSPRHRGEDQEQSILDGNENKEQDHNHDVLDDLDWEIGMDILCVAHNVWRDRQHKKPRSDIFHPICASIELLANQNFQMFDRIIEEYTWCHSKEGIQRMYVQGFEEHGPKRTLLEERDFLKTLIFIGDEDAYWDLLNQYPLNSQRQELRCAYQMGRYGMIEHVILRYPELVNIQNDAKILPYDLASSLLCHPHEYQMTEFHVFSNEWHAERRKDVIAPTLLDFPETPILRLLGPQPPFFQRESEYNL